VRCTPGEVDCSSTLGEVTPGEVHSR